MRFKDIIGHEELKEHLRRMAYSDRIPHALLFSGVAGIGKTMMARAFAQYIQCTDRKDGDSCGRCASCLQHEQLENPDMYYIYPVVKKGNSSRNLSSDFAEEWKEFLNEDSYMRRERWLELIDAGNSQPVIYVNEAAEISRSAIMSNYASKYKIYLIWLPEAMNVETANKLLKLIEEPWDNTLFLLVSNEPGMLLPTIFSRTQRLNFKPLREEDIITGLMKRGFSESTSGSIAAHSEGSMLRAEELAMSKGDSNEFGEMYRRMMRGAYSRKLGDLLALSETLAGEGRERITRFLAYCAHQARENFMYNLRMPQLVSLSEEEHEFSKRFSPFVNHLNVEHLMLETEKARKEISRNANPKVVLYDMMLQIARVIRMTPAK